MALARFQAERDRRGAGDGPAGGHGTRRGDYRLDSFLDEFFPAEAADVKAAAGALVAAARMYQLGEVRRLAGLTQAQVATQLGVRQERVSAIERGDPDATEVRTLAAYVAALGGHLEVVADFGADRVILA